MPEAGSPPPGFAVARYGHAETPEALAWQILTASRIIFEEFFARIRSWEELGTYGRDTEHLLLLDGPFLAAHLALVRAGGHWEGGRAEILGVAGVFSLPQYRRRGLVRHLFGLVERDLEAGREDFGLLFCDPALCRFYAGLGWRPFPGVVTYGDARAPARLDPRIDRARWRPGAAARRPKRGQQVFLGPNTW